MRYILIACLLGLVFSSCVTQERAGCGTKWKQQREVRFKGFL
jgi:hypothetical protein